MAENFEREYFTLMMGSSAMRARIVRAISGAEGMANNITKAAIMAFPVVVPPLREQQEIVRVLSTRLTLLDTASERAERAVDLLQERRTALISAAVTGKIDVRNWKRPGSASDGQTRAENE
jgi:type I restriction enzyme S subunit